MSDTNLSPSQAGEILRIRRLLSRIAELAEQASLTGGLEQGAATSIQHYNAALQRLQQLGVVSSDLFPPLAADSNFDAVGVASALLASYLDDEEEGANGPGVSKRSGNNYNVVRNVGSDLSAAELRDLRDLLQQHLPPSTEEPQP
jgi:hypothetical protein